MNQKIRAEEIQVALPHVAGKQGTALVRMGGRCYYKSTQGIPHKAQSHWPKAQPPLLLSPSILTPLELNKYRIFVLTY